MVCHAACGTVREDRLAYRKRYTPIVSPFCCGDANLPVEEPYG